ncbi:hypothetical protein DFH08DRAFT_959088 [Mycena albidolilacea]|uniref:Uncharacterized protein n=1 Tax=Mycena albidolilacea TaxID=1033008 RepID=A0AAD7A4I8_9AGAR|nr:hypothetical protein DFH08DRAFT_959088 [Mycena albidolilacea]
MPDKPPVATRWLLVALRKLSIIPNPANPRRPFVILIVTTTLLKGQRYNESFIKSFFILMEPASHCHVDALMYALAAVLDDEIFQDVTTLEEIFYPAHPPTRAHKLLAEGFVNWFTFYALRRCSTNNMDAELSESDRKQLMGHIQNSDQFLAIDLGAVLAGRLEVDEEHTQIMKSVAGMSKDRDPTAPISLTAAEHNELQLDPELVELREEKSKLNELVKAATTKLKTLEEETAIAEQKITIAALCVEIHKVDRKHGASLRQLQGTEVATCTPLLSANNSIRAPAAAAGPLDSGKNGPKSARAVRPPSDPMADALEIIQNFTSIDAGNDHFIASVNALQGLLETLPKVCFPGQSPTADGKCPFCDLEMIVKSINAGGGNMATHLHACYSKQIEEMGQKTLDDGYSLFRVLFFSLSVSLNWLTIATTFSPISPVS